MRKKEIQTEAIPMSDKGKIVAGLVVFLVLVTFPLWFALAARADTAMPELEYPSEATQCIEDAAYMRANHMDVLNRWRNALVRDGATEDTTSTGVYFMSLTGTCMDCHDNRDTFCTTCHDYSSVNPKCWDCHVEPRGN